MKINPNNFFFTLKGALILKPQNKRIIVDKKSVEFISRGADVMIPGILHIDNDIKLNDYVIVIEETYYKPIAIGQIIINKNEILEKSSGRAVKSIFYIGDLIWKLLVCRKVSCI